MTVKNLYVFADITKAAMSGRGPRDELDSMSVIAETNEPFTRMELAEKVAGLCHDRESLRGVNFYLIENDSVIEAVEANAEKVGSIFLTISIDINLEMVVLLGSMLEKDKREYQYLIDIVVGEIESLLCKEKKK